MASGLVPGVIFFRGFFLIKKNMLNNCKCYVLVVVLFLPSILFAQWNVSGTNIYNSNSGNVGIGLPQTITPIYKLHLNGTIGWNVPSTAAQNILTVGRYSLNHQMVVTNVVESFKLQTSQNVYLEAFEASSSTFLKLKAQTIELNTPNSITINSLVIPNFIQIGSRPLPSGYKLGVSGKIIAEEINVQLSASWPDYVFSDEYILMPLTELSTYVRKYKHLPDVPDAAEVEKSGLELGEINAVLLKKIEELTLYLIEQDKKINELQIQVAVQRQKLEAIELQK